MHIHLLQHGPDHGPARLTDWLESMGHSYTVFHLYAGELTPRPGECDALIILDGPERLVNDPPDWFKAERKLINRYLDGQKPLLGIGSGALWIAEALDAVIAPGTYPEIGWHQITLAPESTFDLPEQFEAFMRHRLVFSLPESALPLGGSAAAPLQGFCGTLGVSSVYCVISKRRLPAYHHCSMPMSGHSQKLASAGRFIQTSEQILEDAGRFHQLAPLLDRVIPNG